MQDTELVAIATLCFSSGGFHISTKNSNPAFAGTSLLVCGQKTVSYYCIFFKGGLLCAGN
jgi:hypothetical protein